MATFETYATYRTATRVQDDDAISVTSDCTIPDVAAVGFGVPLERMTYHAQFLDDASSSKSYSSSQYSASCDRLPTGGCNDPECDCSSEVDDDDVPLHHHAVFVDEHEQDLPEDEDDGPLSPCASSSSSLSDYLAQHRRLANAGDLAGVEHCDTPKADRHNFPTSFAAALSQGDIPPPRPTSPVEYVAVHNQRRLGTSDSHRHQLALARYLNAEPVRSDPWNHTDPVIHIREHTIANQYAGATLVTERLHDWWSVPFANVRDCLDFTKQILEGVAFMHENQITGLAEAVRPHNIQMDIGLAPAVSPISAREPTKSASAPATPSVESDGLPTVAWTRSEYPVRYYFAASSSTHRVRRLRKGTAAGIEERADDPEAPSIDHVTGDFDEDSDDEDEDEAEMHLRVLDALSREVDDETWDVSTAVDLVAVGHALELVFGKMPFNALRPIIQELCDALVSPTSAHDVLARVESLERELPRHELIRSVREVAA
ncbi:hypothetical protein BDV93DRAFT_522258 [Ceratobasidium sp. AG-I]|nr:hypothetical protein BDV93DRAFT_522258 [Ceratobasidium sp. AG-I]